MVALVLWDVPFTSLVCHAGQNALVRPDAVARTSERLSDIALHFDELYICQVA
jgi:hypothetical protein